MQLNNPTSEIFVPDGSDIEEAVARTTHMCIGAHQDDIEIAACHGILECFGKPDKHFMGVVVTNGSGSPRDDLYAHYTDEQMMAVRRLEQRKAAFVGEYCAQAFLDYTSAAVKDPSNTKIIDDLKRIVTAARPEVIYTHNLADKHDTHVAVSLRLIAALRELPRNERPTRLLGVEIWRDLDWLVDEDKTVLDVSAHENISAALLGVFDSQICGGKRYDLATMGRRRAHATYHESHGVDVSTALSYAMDLTPLIYDDSINPGTYVQSFIDRFAEEVRNRIRRLA
ncbi:MAG: PIG-L family deacetylase [Armatimonadetes bacterium]|nr:PIG-L family deacetylase [Armatimonadota bacterium]